MPAPSTGVGAVAIWTSADQPGLGDQLLGRVIQQELLTRLPGWRMTLCSPDGWRRPAVADGGLVTEPLRDRSPDELAAAATLTVVCSDDPFTLELATRLDPAHPVVPFAVRDVPAVLAARAAFVNDDGKRFDDFELIFRNGSKLESFIQRTGDQPVVRSTETAALAANYARRFGPNAEKEGAA